MARRTKEAVDVGPDPGDRPHRVRRDRSDDQGSVGEVNPIALMTQKERDRILNRMKELMWR